MAAMGVMLRVQAMLFFFSPFLFLLYVTSLHFVFFFLLLFFFTSPLPPPLSCSLQFKNRRDSSQFTRTSLFFYLVYVIFVRLFFLHKK